VSYSAFNLPDFRLIGTLTAGSFVPHDPDVGRAGDSPLALGLAFPAQLQAAILWGLRPDAPRKGNGGVGIDSAWRLFNINRAPITLDVFQDADTGHGVLGAWACRCLLCSSDGDV
jgi:hypothetical protein